MTANMTDNERDEAAIERDVRRTQDQMGDTVQKLEEKLNPKEITRSVIGDDGADVANEALQVTRQNPIPVAMIAVGLIWLLATARSPAIKRMTDRIAPKRNRSEDRRMDLRPRWAEPAPIGPPPETGEHFDRRPMETGSY